LPAPGPASTRRWSSGAMTASRWRGWRTERSRGRVSPPFSVQGAGTA